MKMLLIIAASMLVLYLLVGILRAGGDGIHWGAFRSQAGELVLDLIDPQELVGYARGLDWPDLTLRRLLPDRTVRSTEFRFDRGALGDVNAAMYRNWDAESPIADRQGVERVTGRIAPISQKVALGEETRLRLEGADGADAAVVEAVFNDVRAMTRSVAVRIELARGLAISDGRLIINENGVNQPIDFGVPANHRVAPATPWTDPAAPILDTLLAWVDIYNATNGFVPGSMQTSRRVVNLMLRNEGLRQLASANGITPAVLVRASLDQVLDAYGLPPIVTYDTQVMVNGVVTRVIPEDKLTMLPPAAAPAVLGETMIGVTAEAMRLRRFGQLIEGQEPGVVAVIDEEWDPVATWTKAVAVAVPIVGNPRFLLLADVF